MSAPTLSVDPQWIAYTLTPYLRYAFQHVLRRNLDITPYVERALNCSRSKSDTHIYGDDLAFERLFFAIERRHRGLPAELNSLTDNPELLAVFLIRRAQMKGPYELLGRGLHPSDAWKKYESERLMQIAAENVKAMQNQNQAAVPPYSVPAAAISPAPRAYRMPTVSSPMNSLIDPRLLYAYPGQYATPGLSGTLSLSEMQYYHHRNMEIEASFAMKLAQLRNQQQGYGMQHRILGPQVNPQGYQHDMMLPVRQGHHDDAVNGTRLLHAPDSAFQQGYTSSYARYLGQQRSAKPTQYPSQAPVSTAPMYAAAQPTQHVLQQPGYLQPSSHLYEPAMQNIRQRPVPMLPQPMPVQPVYISTRHDSTHPSLPNLTKPAGISKSISKSSTTASLPDFSDPAQRAVSMAAFKKLSRGEKIEKLLELQRAENAIKPNAMTQVQKFFIEVAAEEAAAAKAATAGEARMKKNKGNAENMVEPPDEQAITASALGYRNHQSTYTTVPGSGGFASYPGYSNITSSFHSPQFHGPSMVPALVPKREEECEEAKKGT